MMCIEEKSDGRLFVFTKIYSRHKRLAPQSFHSFGVNSFSIKREGFILMSVARKDEGIVNAHGNMSRCRLIASWGWRSSQGSGCSPVKAVRELGSERRKTARSLSRTTVDI
jgi:hypothetical protein